MKPHLIKALVAGGLIAAASPAIADPARVDAVDTSRTDEMFFAPAAILPLPVAEEDVVTDILPDDTAAISNEELDGQRGGQTIQITNQTMTAITSGNILNGDYIAGAVTLSDNALSSFNGIGNLLINTGAQVSLQTGMNFTINVGD
ncbi:hypothetical protein IC614_04570 [Allosphingosinicella flava]|uniref:Uncharacterized protein n=1 Tax=Allosphingosinicella flava TaxID=2771430 RepID=A0A7T2GL49_9SPHN|nr:hypothetical protein [Sphingosinicella flava]QPQ55864.1 hypothetical protein IC614_04570 [Sphingosinicella flava]